MFYKHKILNQNYTNHLFFKNQEEAMITTKTIEKPINQLGKLKILLAEDNEVNQLLAKSIFTILGL
jgi:hypothetical protein